MKTIHDSTNIEDVRRAFSEDGPTNQDRADWAEAAIDTFKAETGCDDCDAIPDLLCDLMHLCDAHGADFAKELERAVSSYKVEVKEDGKATLIA